jgi:CPA2 family monovalent cation:H+ antiporter-2
MSAGQKRKPPFPIPELVLRRVFTGHFREKTCTHLHLIEVRESTLTECPDCVALGDAWPSLRMCLVCGYVGCCDQAKNAHMKAHVAATGHPIVRSIDRGEGWIWCYEDEAFIGHASRQLTTPMRKMGR